MIDFNLFMSLTETVGMPTKKGLMFCVFNANYAGKHSQYINKDLIFYYDEKKKDYAKNLLRCVPEFIENNRNKETNKILKSSLEYYNFDLFSVFMSSNSCSPNSLSKEMKQHLKNKWNELKPENISTKWWNNDFIRLLQTKKSPDEVKKTIRKQVKQAPKLLRVPMIEKTEKQPEKPKVLYLNIESTGTDLDDEVIQVSIVTQRGTILFNEMVKPHKQMTERATEINGISDNMLSDFANITEYYGKIKDILEGNKIYAYRIDFDERLLEQSFKKYGLNTDFFKDLDTHDTREYLNNAHIAGREQRDELKRQYDA